MNGYIVLTLSIWIFLFGFKFETIGVKIYINGWTKHYSFEDKK